MWKTKLHHRDATNNDGSPSQQVVPQTMQASPITSPRARSGSHHHDVLYRKARARRTCLFFFLYVVFLSPVAIALKREYSGASDKKTNLLVPIMHEGGPRFLIALFTWLTVLIFSYLAIRIVGNRFGLKLHEKEISKHKDDVMKMVYYGITMAAVGGIAIRIDEGLVNSETRLSFIPLCLVYLVFYTILFETLKDRDITLSVGIFSNKLGILVVFVAFVTVLAVLASLFISAWQVCLFVCF